MSRIIIHYPFKIDRSRKSASQIRPIKIVDTFKKLGYEIDLIEGYGKERSQQIANIKRNICNGINYAFLYSECTTMPTLLSESHHLPFYPYLDFGFFKFCKAHRIPIGLFYRDIYWCFPENVKGWKGRIAKWFYKYDLYKYNQLVDHLFVPSIEMIKYIPISLRMPISELYPGCENVTILEKCKKDDRTINILYIGGIGHHYDISMMVGVVSHMRDVSFTICCRKEDWELVKREYDTFLQAGNIQIVHLSGDELKLLYEKTDIFCLFVKPDKYWEFAVPYKLFETVGYCKPILASSGTWVARFVNDNHIGIVCEYDEEHLMDMLLQLRGKNELLHQCALNVTAIKPQNTWSSRCLKIDEILKSINTGD